MGLRLGLDVLRIEGEGGTGLATYDYRCTKCGDEFSVEQSMLDKPLVRCRNCRGKLEKLLPKSLNLIFKGSGFYVTDYKKSEAKGKKAPGASPASQPKESSFKKAAEKNTGGEGTT